MEISENRIPENPLSAQVEPVRRTNKSDSRQCDGEIGNNPKYFPDDAADITLLRFLGVLWPARLPLAIFSLSIVLITLIYSLFIPKTYEAMATVVSPPDRRNVGLMASIASTGMMDGIPVGEFVGSGRPNVNLFVNVLRSRSVAEAAVSRFDLQSWYAAKHFDDAVKQLRNLVEVSVSKEGVVSITVEDTDPKMTADIANFYVQELDQRLVKYENSRASRRRQFLENRIAKTEQDLRVAEEALRDHQKQHRIFAVPEQTRGLMETAAMIQGRIIANEVQLESLQTYANENNTQVVLLKRQLDELRRQLAKVEFGAASQGPEVSIAAASAKAPNESEVAGEAEQVPFADYPEISLQLARLTREVTIQTTVYTLLKQQLEETKISEMMDVPNIQVLDPAIPPLQKARPKILLNLLIAGFCSFLIGIVGVIGWEYKKILLQQWNEIEASNRKISNKVSTSVDSQFQEIPIATETKAK